LLFIIDFTTLGATATPEGGLTQEIPFFAAAIFSGEDLI
jgi:hypothetical protein